MFVSTAYIYDKMIEKFSIFYPNDYIGMNENVVIKFILNMMD